MNIVQGIARMEFSFQGRVLLQNWVQEFLLPGDPAVTAAALENMVDNIKDGNSIAEAVTAFCREIVENAE